MTYRPKRSEYNSKDADNSPKNLSDKNKQVSSQKFRRCPRGVMIKAMDCGIVVSEFELQSCYYVHFRENNLWERYGPPLPPRYGLNSTKNIDIESKNAVNHLKTSRGEIWPKRSERKTKTTKMRNKINTRNKMGYKIIAGMKSESPKNVFIKIIIK